jgi:hypothetical protein
MENWRLEKEVKERYGYRQRREAQPDIAGGDCGGGAAGSSLLPPRPENGGTDSAAHPRAAMGREIQAERTRLNDARRVGRVGEYWKKVNSITVIYGRCLSFNLEPQNQVLEHLQTVEAAVRFTPLGGFVGGFRGCGATSAHPTWRRVRDSHPLAQPKCALVNPPAHLPPSTTLWGVRPFFVLSSAGTPSSPAALPACPAPCASGNRELLLTLLLYRRPTGCAGPPLYLLRRRSFSSPASAPCLSCAPCVGGGRELHPSSSTGDPRGCAAPLAPSPQTLRALAPVRPAAADTAEEQSSVASSSRRQRLKGCAPQ